MGIDSRPVRDWICGPVNTLGSGPGYVVSYAAAAKAWSAGSDYVKSAAPRAAGARSLLRSVLKQVR